MSEPAVVYAAADLKDAAERAANRGLSLRLSGPHAAAIGGPSDAVAVDRIGQAGRCADVLITSPIVSPEEAEHLAADDRSLLLTVDHFAHVELLSGVSWPREPRLLIELSLGPARFGGRPGRDAVDLAGVINETPGVTFGGLSAAVSSPGMADSMLRTAEQIQAAGVDVPLLSAAAKPDEMDGLPSGHEVRQSPSPRCLAVSVLSRPSLETCVVNAGTRNGLLAKAVLTLGRSPFRAESEARVRAVEDDRALLTIAGESVEALIGDTINIFGVEAPQAARAETV